MYAEELFAAAGEYTTLAAVAGAPKDQLGELPTTTTWTITTLTFTTITPN
jgi:hypothetical protein